MEHERQVKSPWLEYSTGSGAARDMLLLCGRDGGSK